MDTNLPVPAQAEVVQPEQEAPQGAPEGAGASEVAETEEQRASRAGRELNERKRNQANAFRRLQDDARAAREETAELRRLVYDRLTQKPEPPPPDNGPQRDQFQTYEDFVEARASWKTKSEARAEVMRQLQQIAEQTQEVQQRQEAARVMQAHAQRVQEFAKNTPDFDEVTAREDVVIPNSAARMIAGMPDSAAVLYAIGQEPAIAAYLQQMQPSEQAIYLGRISQALTRPPQVSKAPPPGKTVGARSTGDGSPSDSDSVDDWIRKRNAQLNKGRG